MFFYVVWTTKTQCSYKLGLAGLEKIFILSLANCRNKGVVNLFSLFLLLVKLAGS